MNETAHLLESGTALVGIVTHPAREIAATGIAAVLLNAGIVHRVGPNRLYVTLARRLAARGFPVLRFDLSGIGDSPVRADHLPFLESCTAEAIDAMNHLQSLNGCTRFVLMGLCSGAEVALRSAVADDRAAGVVLINARRYGADEAALAQVRQRALARHYRRMAVSRSFAAHSARRLVKGGLGFGSIARGIVSQIPRPRGRLDLGKTTVDLFNGLLHRGTEIYCIHSEADEGLDHFHVLLGRAKDSLCSRDGFQMEMIEGADHTFTMWWSRVELLERIERWIQAKFGNG